MDRIAITPTVALVLAGLLAGAVAPAWAAAGGGSDEAADAAWAGVTVLMQDGWRYRDVAVYLDPHGAGLWVRRADGAERLVAAGAVARIIDADGRIVTDQVLAGEAPPAGVRPGLPPAGRREPASRAADGPPDVGWDGTRPGHVATSEQDRPSATPTAAQDADPDPRAFRVALGLEGGFGLMAGDWYNGLDARWGAGARLRVTTHERTYLGLGVRYHDLELDRSWVPVGTDDGVELGSSLLIIEATMGWASLPTDNGSRAYFELGAALVEHTLTAEYEGMEASESQQNGAFVARAGVLVPLGGALHLDLNGSWTYKGLIFSEPEEASGSLLGVHAGLTWAY